MTLVLFANQIIYGAHPPHSPAHHLLRKDSFLEARQGEDKQGGWRFG